MRIVSLLALCCIFSVNTLAQSQESVEEVKKAAEEGNPEAQFRLAVMYHSGEGIPKDPSKAVEWYTRVAGQGDVSAQFILAVMYAKGDGIAVDLLNAAKWFRNA